MRRVRLAVDRASHRVRCFCWCDAHTGRQRWQAVPGDQEAHVAVAVLIELVNAAERIQHDQAVAFRVF